MKRHTFVGLLAASCVSAAERDTRFEPLGKHNDGTSEDPS